MKNEKQNLPEETIGNNYRFDALVFELFFKKAMVETP